MKDLKITKESIVYDILVQLCIKIFEDGATVDEIVSGIYSVDCGLLRDDCIDAELDVLLVNNMISFNKESSKYNITAKGCEFYIDLETPDSHKD